MSLKDFPERSLQFFLDFLEKAEGITFLIAMLAAQAGSHVLEKSTEVTTMSKLLTSAGIAMLLLLMGMPTLVRAQEERAPRQEEPRAEPKHEQEAPNAEPKRQDEAKPSKQEKKEQKQEEKQSREMSQPNQNTHARPAGKGGHIPDDKFRANFGRSHTFVVQRTTVVNNQPGFIYGGYTFVFVDPWPAEWAYTDDCYVDYIDGEYFLFDVLHPGVQVALFVVM